MFTFSRSLIEDAKAVAAELLKTGEKIQAIPFGKDNDSLFVSVSQEFVKGVGEFKIGETKFFIGSKRIR